MQLTLLLIGCIFDTVNNEHGKRYRVNAKYVPTLANLSVACHLFITLIKLTIIVAGMLAQLKTIQVAKVSRNVRKFQATFKKAKTAPDQIFQ